MPSLFANDIGGIGAALQADRSHRDALSQAAISRLIQANQEAERKREWELSHQQQMKQAADTLALNQQQLSQQRDAALAAALRFKQEMAFKELNHAQQVRSAADTLALNQQQLSQQRDNALAAALRFKQEMAFKEKEFNEDSLPSLQQSKDVRVKEAADKLAAERKRALGESLRYHVENRLPYDPSQFKDLDPEVREPLLAYDASNRKSEADAVQKAQQAALFANRFKLIEKRADELAKSPGTGMFGGVSPFRLGSGSNPDNQPAQAEQAKTVKDRLETFRAQFAALTDPKTGLVEVDQSTGDFVPRSGLVRPWMTGSNAPPTNLNWNRGNSLAQAMPNATATQGDTSEAQPMVANGGAPAMQVPTITGTSNIQSVIAEANRAIQLGADPAAVKARLIKMGIQTQ